MEFKNVDTIENWDKWKSVLGSAVNMGETIGMSEEIISKAAEKLGDFLSAAVDPENREQRLLKELWSSADNRERVVLARVVVKMVR